MSIVKLDLRQQNSSQSGQAACSKQVPAPLVKIDLTPEKQLERKSDHSNYCSTNSTNSATSSNTQGHLSPTSSNISLPAAYQNTSSSLTQISSRVQPNSIANFMNNPFSIGSSPTQKNAASTIVINSNYNSTSPNSALNQLINGSTTHLNLGSQTSIPAQNPRSSIQQERKISQNSTEVSNDESAPNLQLLQLKLQQQLQENNELKEQLTKERSKTKMIITENLTMQEELRKAQTKLKEFEQLNMMRQSQAFSHRASWMRSSPTKKPFTPIHSSNPRGVTNPAQKQMVNEFSADFSYDKYTAPMMENQINQPIHQNQLSQHSILDILHNLNGEEDSFYTDRNNQGITSGADKQESVKVSQFTKRKQTTLNSQIRRRSNLTPSFNRLDTMNTIPKKIYS